MLYKRLALNNSPRKFRIGLCMPTFLKLAFLLFQKKDLTTQNKVIDAGHLSLMTLHHIDI